MANIVCKSRNCNTKTCCPKDSKSFVLRIRAVVKAPLINHLFGTICLIPLCMESIWLFNLNEELRDFEHKLQVYLFSLCTSK